MPNDLILSLILEMLLMYLISSLLILAVNKSLSTLITEFFGLNLNGSPVICSTVPTTKSGPDCISINNSPLGTSTSNLPVLANISKLVPTPEIDKLEFA